MLRYLSRSVCCCERGGGEGGLAAETVELELEVGEQDGWALLDAVEAGDVEAARREAAILGDEKVVVDVLLRGVGGQTGLRLAARSGFVELVEWMGTLRGWLRLAKQRDEFGATALWSSVCNGQMDMATVLLRLPGAGEHGDLPDIDGRTPFWVACALGNLAAAKEAAGILPNMRVQFVQPDGAGVTPFARACRSGNLQIAKWLADEPLASVSLLSPDRHGNTPLRQALESSQTQLLHWLLSMPRASAHIRRTATVDDDPPWLQRCKDTINAELVRQSSACRAWGDASLVVARCPLPVWGAVLSCLTATVGSRISAEDGNAAF